MMSEHIVAGVRAALAPLADPDQARAMRAYQRDQFPFLGIPAPRRRAAVGRLGQGWTQQESLATAGLLWALPEREYKYTAADALLQASRCFDGSVIAPLLALAQREPWWDTVDALATVVGNVVRARRSAEPEVLEAMDAALVDPCLWVRRIAMLHQRGWRLETDEGRLFRHALALAHATDFFIRKAIGWALRDYGRWNQPALKAFLNAHSDSFSPLTVREASRHLI